MGFSHSTLWTQEMVDKLRMLKAERKTVKEIAVEMGMTVTTINKAWGRYRIGQQPRPIIKSPTESPTPRTVTFSVIAEKYDTRQAILREIAKIPKGEFMEQAELCRLASGPDRSRFVRCVEAHAGEFMLYRIKIKLGEAAEGRWYWAAREDIAKAKAKVEEYL